MIEQVARKCVPRAPSCASPRQWRASLAGAAARAASRRPVAMPPGAPALQMAGV
jgi:hypothetical protein